MGKTRRKVRKPEEIIRLLKQADVLASQGNTVEKICRDLAISDATYYKWRKEYGGMGMDQVVNPQFVVQL